jgi:PIN domain
LNLYAESSAVLSWLLGDEQAERVRKALSDAQTVVASELTLVECDRVLVKSVHTQKLSEASAADRSARLRQAAEHWVLFRLEDEVLDRARRPSPPSRCVRSTCFILRPRWLPAAQYRELRFFRWTNAYEAAHVDWG